MKRIYLIVVIAVMLGCVTKEESNMNVEQLYVNDVHSYAKPEEAVLTHIDLDLEVDFQKKIISGEAKITFNAKDDIGHLILDARGLIIRSIWSDNGDELNYTMGEEDPILGSELKIDIDSSFSSLIIVYETSPDAEAIQWLAPIQTADKNDPFLFTQSQAILARTWIPLQDSPGIRFTYTAQVKVPEGLMALMSAENPQSINETGLYQFKMEQPIPAYLMSLVVGNLEFRSLGNRTGVYAEPSLIDRAVYEFEETEKMVEIAESLYGPYQWERYDMVVLPPSFPFGGMENPRITFATPTIIAGDRSLVALIAHELAHSWSGNLVTNATWNDFWINEGFTVYFEQRIMEELYGREYAEMLASLSQQDLKIEVENFIVEGKEGDSRLKLDLTGRNPDDGVNSIAYDKGYSFLRYLEEMVGRQTFDPFLKEYFTSHSFQSMTTEGFLKYMKEHLFDENSIPYPEKEVSKWVYQPGLPETLPSINSERFGKVELQIQLFMGGVSPMDLNTDQWSTQEWLHFIKNLPSDISNDQIGWLDKAFKLSEGGNAEILDEWFILAVRHNYDAAYPAMENFLIHTGRRKFLTPLYRAMIENPSTRELAMKIYKKARPNYHSVSVNTLDEVLDWKEGNSPK